MVARVVHVTSCGNFAYIALGVCFAVIFRHYLLSSVALSGRQCLKNLWTRTPLSDSEETEIVKLGTDCLKNLCTRTSSIRNQSTLAQSITSIFHSNKSNLSTNGGADAKRRHLSKRRSRPWLIGIFSTSSPYNTSGSVPLWLIEHVCVWHDEVSLVVNSSFSANFKFKPML